MADDPADPDRRKFLQLATCALGAGVGLAVVVPVIEMAGDPAGQQTVTAPTAPLDLGTADRLKVGTQWKRYDVIAPVVADAWTSARDVVLGSAFVRQPQQGKVEALSAVCPHLGCAVGYDPAAGSFLCPCHNSRWNNDGLLAGAAKAKRSLDPLPIEIVDGRLRLTWKVYKLDTADREPA